MQRKKIALISDAWVPQVNGVVTTFQSIIPILEKKGFQIKILHPEMFSNFSYPWYKEIKISYNTKKITDKFFKDYKPDIVHIITEGPVGFAGRKFCIKNKLKYTSSFHTRFPDYVKQRAYIPKTFTYSLLRRLHDKSVSVLVPSNSMIKELYYSKILKEFIADCLNVKMYHYADPLASLTINVNKPGDRFSWHYDTNEFTVTMLVQDCDEGGVFQYVPNIRNKEDECYDEVLKLLKGDQTRVKEIKLDEGDLQLFKGRYALHRATRAEGNKTRNLVVFTYTEKENVIGASYRSNELYGKTLDVHNEKRIRSDSLTD